MGLYDHKAYWDTRHFFRLRIFGIRRFLYGRREALKETAQSASIVVALMGTFWKTLLLSIFLIVVLEWMDLIVRNNVLPHLLSNTEGYNHLIVKLQLFFHRHRESADEFLGTVAGVGGVFLGLYFAAVSVVAGTMFPNVPGIIREELVRERVGNQYVRILALLSTISVLLLGYQSIGPGAGVLTLSFVLTLSVFGVLSFVQLGKRVFTLLDLSELFRPTLADLYASVQNATINGFAWNDGGFQNHFKAKAARGLRSLEVFIGKALESREKEEEPLVRMVRSACQFFSSYMSNKRLIPTNSKWYESTIVHQNWFLADSTSLSLALNTNVGIEPTTKPNLYWLEDRIIEILSAAILSLLAAKQIQTAYKLLEPICSVLKVCGKELALEEAKRLMGLANSQITSHAKTGKSSAPSDYEMALVDLHGYCILNFTLGFFQALGQLSHAEMKREIAGIPWTHPESPYQHGFPFSMLERLEFIQRTVSFEAQVERSPISPRWYRDQLIIQKYVELVSSGFDFLVELLRTEFVDVAKSYQNDSQIMYSTMHAHRGLEVCAKLEYHINANKDKIDSFAESHILSDLKWPECNWERLLSEIGLRREELIEILAKSLPVLSLLDRRANSPDFFGQSYNVVYTHIIRLLEQNRGPEFARMFPAYLFSAIQSYDNLRKEKALAEADMQAKLIFGTEPLMDLLDLSGYAKTYSELFLNPDLWDSCAKTWDTYLNALPNENQFVSLLVSTVEFRRAQFSLIPRDILRTNWLMNLGRTLAAMDLIDVIGHRQHLGDNRLRLEHRSPFIRALCRGRFEPTVSAAEVFVLTYLLNRPENKTTGFKDTDRLIEQIREEAERQQNPSLSEPIRETE